MICERCKIREANIKYTEVINGVKREHNLCSQCAKEMDFGQYSSIFDGDFPLGKLLSGLLGMGETAAPEDQERFQVTCPTCHTTYQEFLKNSRFGCADCYQVFDLLIADNIKKLQGSDSHKGKVPRFKPRAAAGEPSLEELEPEIEPLDSAGGEEEKLRRQLDQAVRAEDYELAARLRDEIRSLEQSSASDHGAQPEGGVSEE